MSGKAFERRKATKRAWKEAARDGKYNLPSGVWAPRPSSGNSMSRDYSPQQSGKGKS